MRVEEEYEEEDDVNFVNQTGTRYSSKPFSTNASALGVRAVCKRRGSDHCVLVQNGDSLQPHKQGTQTISARSAQGIGNGWDPGPPVWDPGTPMHGLQTQRPHLTLWLEEVDLNRYPKAQARGPANSNFNSLFDPRIQGDAKNTATVNQLTMHQSSPGQGRHLSHKACAIQTSSLCLHWIKHKAARKRKTSKWAVSTDSLARETESVGASGTIRGAEAETTMGHDL